MTAVAGQFKLRRGDFELDMAFEIPGQGITAVFGESGCGKTTLLRCIAGLERAAGKLVVNDVPWQDDAGGLFLAPHQRAIGYVFQEAGLFEHLDVRGNLQYGLQRIPVDQRRVRFDDVVAWFELQDLLGRSVDGLSGGERQRVAIGRALLTSPGLLLLDEPLASIDERRRREFMPYLDRLHRELSIPVLYVSHSYEETSRLADYLLLLDNGRCIADGPLFEMLTRLDLPLSHADAAGAVLDATVEAHDDAFALTRVAVAGCVVSIPRHDAAIGVGLRLRIRASDVSLALEAPVLSSILNIFPATVVEVQDDPPAQAIVKLDIGGPILLARLTRKSIHALAVEPGLKCFAQVKGVAVVR
jgi:molybdate transport system ATP-binding protein